MNRATGCLLTTLTTYYIACVPDPLVINIQKSIVKGYYKIQFEKQFEYQTIVHSVVINTFYGLAKLRRSATRPTDLSKRFPSLPLCWDPTFKVLSRS